MLIRTTSFHFDTSWPLSIYVFLFDSNFGIDGGTVVLIAPVPGQCLFFTFYRPIII